MYFRGGITICEEAQKPAGFWIRLGSAFFDRIIVVTSFFIISTIILIIFNPFVDALNTANAENMENIRKGYMVVPMDQMFIEKYRKMYTFQYLSFFMVCIVYFFLLPILWNGYTFGKKVTSTRIVRLNGKKIGIGTMLLRELVSGIIYILTLGIGVLISACMVAFRKDKRSLHDLIARTHVIYEK